MKNDKERRKIAMKWWNSLEYNVQSYYAHMFFSFGRQPNTLTGREIQMIKEGDKPSLGVEEISSDMAASFFIEREDNREITWDCVYEIVHLMNCSIFKDEDPIIISGGQLIDGQHRMLALCLSHQDSWTFEVQRL